MLFHKYWWHFLEFIDDDEIPEIYLSHENITSNSVIFTWRPVYCNKVKGPLEYIFETKSRDNNSCNCTPIHFNPGENTLVLTVDQLEPFSNYTSHLTLARDGVSRNGSPIEYVTKPAGNIKIKIMLYSYVTQSNMK